MSRSKDALRAAPGSRQVLEVYADELLERADPRAELVRRSLRGDSIDPWLDEHGAALRSSLGAAELRLCNGLVHQVEYELEGWLDLPPDTLSAHPLGFLLTPSFGKAETSAHAERLRYVLETSSPFGLDLRCSEEWNGLKRLAKTMPTLSVHALRVSSAAVSWLQDLTAPNLRALSLGELSGPVAEGPFGATVSWLSIRSLEHLARALEWPALRVLDLRRVALDRAAEASLRKWLERGERTVLHERFSLVDPHPLADVFNAKGSWWPRPGGGTSRAVASARHDEFASVTHKTLRGYREGEPAWSKELPSEVRTLVGHADGFDLLLTNGEAVAFDREGTPVSRPPPSPVDSRVATSARERATIDGEAVVISDRSTGAELARWPLGPGLEAIVATASGFVCGTRLHLWHVAVGTAPRLLEEALDGRQLLLAANGSWIAASFTRTSVFQVSDDGARRKSCHWPATFSRDGGPLLVQALAVEESGRAIVGMSDEAINLLDPTGGQAFKPGEHRGQPYRHWVFIYGSNILVSD